MKEKTFMAIQLAVVALMSSAAGYAFLHTRTVYEFNGLCIYRYIVYVVAVFLGYVCFSKYKRLVGLGYSLVLSAIAVSPMGSAAIEQFPLFVPFLALIMGAASILVFPDSRRKGFLEFLIVLILPSILAESNIVGSAGLLATKESPGYLLTSAVTVCVVGGYFFLRYATLANLSRIALLSSGGSSIDVAKVSRSNNSIVGLIVLSACGTAFSLVVAAQFAAELLQGAFISQPINVVALALGLAFALIALLYIFQLYGRRSLRTTKQIQSIEKMSRATEDKLSH